MHRLCHKGKNDSGIIIGKDGTLAAPLFVCQDFTVRIIWQGCHQRADGGDRMHKSRPLTFPSTGEDTAVLKSTVAAGLLILLVIRRLHLPPHERCDTQSSVFIGTV